MVPLICDLVPHAEKDGANVHLMGGLCHLNVEGSFVIIPVGR